MLQSSIGSTVPFPLIFALLSFSKMILLKVLGLVSSLCFKITKHPEPLISNKNSLTLISTISHLLTVIAITSNPSLIVLRMLMLRFPIPVLFLNLLPDYPKHTPVPWTSSKIRNPCPPLNHADLVLN